MWRMPGSNSAWFRHKNRASGLDSYESIWALKHKLLIVLQKLHCDYRRGDDIKNNSEFKGIYINSWNLEKRGVM